MIDNQKLPEILHQAGLRITPQRLAICKLIADSDRHLTACEIYDQLKESFPSLSLATIYNTADVLAATGQINKFANILDGRVHYDGDTSSHVHLVCVQCHQIIDYQSGLLDQIETEVYQTSGYRLLDCQVIFYGVCPDCNQRINLQSHV